MALSDHSTTRERWNTCGRSNVGSRLQSWSTAVGAAGPDCLQQIHLKRQTMSDSIPNLHSLQQQQQQQ